MTTSGATFIALLRAVNVGGPKGARAGKLAMSELKRLCEGCGFTHVRTYIASGNVVFASARPDGAPTSEAEVKAALETALNGGVHPGGGLSPAGAKPFVVLVRTAAELAEVLAANPFPDAPGNRAVAIFLDAPPPADALYHVTGQTTEQIALGRREIYVHYPDGQATAKLTLPAAKTGTARNMNTVAKLVEMGG